VAYNNVNKRNAAHVTSNATVLLRTLRPNSVRYSAPCPVATLYRCYLYRPVRAYLATLFLNNMEAGGRNLCLRSHEGGGFSTRRLPENLARIEIRTL